MSVFQYEKVKDPTYYGENRVPAHSDHRYYGSVEEMEQHVEKDVYKRQDRKKRKWEDGTVQMHLRISPGGRWRGFCAVSYTHLDVYKRQMLYCVCIK